MDGEVQSFIKVWITANLCLCYCYYIAARIPKGFLRLLSLLPIFYLFLILPFNLYSFHLGAPTTFFLVWLATFKLLLFAFDQGPLFPLPLNIFHFISIAALPIKLKHDPHSTSPNNNTHPPHQTTQNWTPNPEKSKAHYSSASAMAKSLLWGLKALLLAVIIRAYDYSENLHPHLILALYCCHLYLGIELVLAVCAVPARAIFGFEMEPQFNEPYFSTSLQDFWGRRWNLMVTSILRPTVYGPVRHLSTLVMGSNGGPQPAMMATFAVSGLMHELIYFYLTRALPTWEVTWFFVLQGFWTAIEVAAKKALVRRGWRLHRAVSGPLTLAFVAVTGKWLFFPQLLRNGVVSRAIGEYAIMADFAKSNLPLHLFISRK